MLMTTVRFNVAACRGGRAMRALTRVSDETASSKLFPSNREILDQALETAARTLGLRLVTANAITPREIERALAGPIQIAGATISESRTDHQYEGCKIPRPHVPAQCACSHRRGDGKRRWVLLHCMSQFLCRFSAAGNEHFTTRSGRRRPKSAKARNRGSRPRSGRAASLAMEI